MTLLRVYNKCTGPSCALVNQISITTVSRPKYGNCSIEPRSGIAWTTSFTITCVNFNNENTFEYYQKNKNDNSTMGKSLKYKYNIKLFKEPQGCVLLH